MYHLAHAIHTGRVAAEILTFAIGAAIGFAGLIKELVEERFKFGIDSRIVATEATFGVDHNALIVFGAATHIVFDGDSVGR